MVVDKKTLIKGYKAKLISTIVDIICVMSSIVGL